MFLLSLIEALWEIRMGKVAYLLYRSRFHKGSNNAERIRRIVGYENHSPNFLISGRKNVFRFSLKWFEPTAI